MPSGLSAKWMMVDGQKPFPTISDSGMGVEYEKFTNLSWLVFLYPFILDMPALRKEFEQLCECLRQNASLALPELAPWPPGPLFFLKAENNLCHLDLLVNGGAEATEEASEGDLEASEEVEFENCLESAAANRCCPCPACPWCPWGNSLVELDDIWFPKSPIKKKKHYFFEGEKKVKAISLMETVKCAKCIKHV